MGVQNYKVIILVFTAVLALLWLHLRFNDCWFIRRRFFTELCIYNDSTGGSQYQARYVDLKFNMLV
jgi:hypothetical protein